MSDTHATLWAYPWDLHDEDPDRAIARIQEAGLDGVSLASAYHSFDMLRPHLRKGVRLQSGESSVYFRYEKALYADTVIQPHVSPLMGGDDWYAEAAKATRSAGIDLIAWTVFLHNSYQAAHHPDCAERSPLGDLSTHHLCPSNPHVRTFACALARNLATRYGIAVLECESLNFGGFGHAHFHLKHGADLGQGGRFLYSLCFCEACLAAGDRAGLDSLTLMNAVRDRLFASLESGKPIVESHSELADEMEDLQGYLDCREAAVTSLAEEVKRAAGVPTTFIFIGHPAVTGVNRAQISERVDGVEVLSYTSDPERTRATIGALRNDVDPISRLVLGLAAYPPASPNADVLTANVEAAVREGVRKFSFYNYGIMPYPNLGWVRDALNQIQA